MNYMPKEFIEEELKKMDESKQEACEPKENGTKVVKKKRNCRTTLSHLDQDMHF